MSSDYFTDPLNFIISVIFDLYIIVVMLRFLLQCVRAEFYNPVSQLLLKLTNPAVMPLRRIIPAWRQYDIASLILALLLTVVKLLLISLIIGRNIAPGPLLVFALAELVTLILNIYLFAILIKIILSWLAPHQYNPAIGLLSQLTAPVLRPAQKLLPPVSGFDFSALLVLILIQLSKYLLIPPILALAKLF